MNSLTFHLRTPRYEHRLNNQPTMSDLLHAVLLNALRQYKFDGFPLWRMADGKDHVKIEVTFRKTITNQCFDKKGAENRRRPTPLLASGQTSDDDTDTSSPTNALYGAGGDTTNAADTTRHRKRLHNIRPHPEDSYHRAITSHQETCHTTYYTRQPAKEEIKTELSARADQRF